MYADRVTRFDAGRYEGLLSESPFPEPADEAPMTQVLMVVVPSLTALTATGLRLWWQARRDQRRQQTLRVLAERFPRTGVVEIHDVRDDGSRLVVRIGPSATRRDDVR
ncbi:hypothetical protein GCM10029964_092070 [Kibdelosporangium lantanae]